MYSKALLNKYIELKLAEKGLNYSAFADLLGVAAGNLTRAMKNENFSFTLAQFSEIVRILELTPEQTMHVLVGKNAKRAASQLASSYAEKLVEDLLRKQK